MRETRCGMQGKAANDNMRKKEQYEGKSMGCTCNNKSMHAHSLPLPSYTALYFSSSSLPLLAFCIVFLLFWHCYPYILMVKIKMQYSYSCKPHPFSHVKLYVHKVAFDYAEMHVLLALGWHSTDK